MLRPGGGEILVADEADLGRHQGEQAVALEERVEVEMVLHDDEPPQAQQLVERVPDQGGPAQGRLAGQGVGEDGRQPGSSLYGRP